MKKFVYTLLYFLAISTVFGQSKKMKDIDAIKSMCGCFEIEFNFAETFVLIDDENYLIMSSAAYNSLNEIQKKNILYYNEIIHSDLSTIETLGGGSARCMIAENFLEKK